MFRSLPFLLVGELPGERWLSANDDHALRFALAGAGLLAADVLLPIPSSIVGTMLGRAPGLRRGLRGGLRRDHGSGSRPPTSSAAACCASATWRCLRRRRWRCVFLSRPVPVLAEAVVLAAGAARVSWPQFLLACGSGNLIYAGALALNGAQLVPERRSAPGSCLPMLLPVAAWLIWRVVRRTTHQGG